MNTWNHALCADNLKKYWIIYSINNVCTAWGRNFQQVQADDDNECAQKRRVQVEQETPVLSSNFRGFVFGLFNFFFWYVIFVINRNFCELPVGLSRMKHATKL